MKMIFLFASALFIFTVSQAQWEPDVRLTNNADSSLTYLGMTHNIAASFDTVHVVWWDKSDGNWEIYYRRSTNGGVSWQIAIRLTNNPEKSTSPSVAVSGSVVHVVWCDWKTGNREIYYRRSKDGGMNWEEEQRLTDDVANSHGPTIAVSGSYVHLVWVSWDEVGGTREIHYRRSINGGTSWEPETWLSYNSYLAYNPSIASTGLDVLIVWNNSYDGNLEIFSRRSTDGGLNWEQVVQLTNAPGSSEIPSVSISGSNIHLVWSDKREGGPRIFYKQSVDGGLSWGEDTRITNTISASPNIASSDTLVRVVWEDYRNGIPEIYCKYSVNGGSDWSADSLLNDISFSSQRPFIAISNTALHVVWFDFRDGNYEIYYKRDPTGGNLPTGIVTDMVNSSDDLVDIYPNPASNILNIRLNQIADKIILIRLFDSGGRIIGIYNFNSWMGSNQYSIDVNDYSSGLYYIECTSGCQKYFSKVMINK